MFHFYLSPFVSSRRGGGWRVLVQVCRRWRNVVFESPLHLGVKLRCTARTSLRGILDVWPALPISMKQHCSTLSQVERDAIQAILELHQRVCEIDLTGISKNLFEQIGQTMRKPFPALTKLVLESDSPSLPELPHSFLGVSASRLRTLKLKHIPFPALPSLLLSTTDLRCLELYSIPPSTYIPSQVIVTCLSGMTRLHLLTIKFYSPQSRHSQSLPSSPSTRTILPALTHLRFRGRCNYLEDLVASINAPLLNTVSLSFFKSGTYDTPQLFKFISCTDQFRSPCRVDAFFYDNTIMVKVYLRTELASSSALELEVLQSDWRLSSLAQLCHSSLSSLSTLERLDIRRGGFDTSGLPYNIEDAEWLVLLHRFASVKHLKVSKSLGLPVMSTLAAPAGMTVLPALQNIFLEGLQPSGSLRVVVDQLIAARQLSGHSISVHNWDRLNDTIREMNARMQVHNQQHETSSQSIVLGQ